MKILGFDFSVTREQPVPTIKATDLDQFALALGGYADNPFDGEKFLGGFGATSIGGLDYWTLRKRSNQLFKENLFAVGLIRRLITNEINTGLTPETSPDEELLPFGEDFLVDWAETVETRFGVWAKAPKLCDWKHTGTFGAIQRAARMEALIAGDVLVVLRSTPGTGLPKVQLISGEKVQTPWLEKFKLRKGHKVSHGVELDARGRVTAHWVKQDDGSSKRLPAWGEKSGRRLSWLVYGTDKRLDEVRGVPLLSLVLQSLKEIDRYRDSVQRKAVINSMLAMFVKKTQDKMGTLPLTGGAVRKDQVTATDSDGAKRSFNVESQVPGLVIQELQMGEEPVAFGSQGTDDSYGVFEEAIIQAVAWSNEVPPEILRLAFSNNYSASQAAINEFKIYLNKVWTDWGETFCTPIYTEWMISEMLSQKLTAPGFLTAWRDPKLYDVFGSWTCVDWYGSIKPSTDMLKQAKGSELLLELGLTTRAREARGATGTKFSKNAKRLKRENELLAAAQRPLAEFRKEFGVEPTQDAGILARDALGEILGAIADIKEES